MENRRAVEEGRRVDEDLLANCRFMLLLSRFLFTTREYGMVMFAVASVGVCLSVCNALTFEILDLESSFWYAGTSSEYLGQGSISRSSGQGHNHRSE